MTEPPDDGLAGAVADGLPVDWEAAARAAPESDAYIEQLRVLNEIARLHQALHAELSPVLESSRPAPAPPADVSGFSWGNYQLREEIGRGSYGVVYRAHDPSLRRDLAIKLLHPSIAEQPELADRIFREGQALARVHHQNVVAVYAVTSYADRLGLCMELVHGVTLRDLLAGRGRLNADEAAVVGQAVCRALVAVHGAGLVHRDVTARNVMRDENGRIVLMDFGTGLELTAAAPERRAAGTPLYMAPELFDGGTASAVTDVYSVGVLLHYLTTKRFPIEGATLADVMRAHRDGQAATLVSEHRADLSEGFVRVVAKALARDPAARYQSAAQFAHALAEVTGAKADGAAPATAWRPLAAAALTVVAAAAGLALMGRLSTYAFNSVLGVPPPFSEITWAESFRWGAKSVVAPMAMALALGVGYFLLDAAVQAIKGSPIGDLAGRRLVWLRTSAQALGLERTTGAARAVVTAAVVAFIWVRYIEFPSLIDAYTAVGEPTDAHLLALSSHNMAAQDAYRQWLSILLVGLSAAWFAIFRRARTRRESLPLSLELSALGTVAVLVLLLNWPYRLFFQADLERVTYQGADCHLVLERDSAALVVCPTLGLHPLPVPLPDPALTRLRVTSNVFDALVAARR